MELFYELPSLYRLRVTCLLVGLALSRLSIFPVLPGPALLAVWGTSNPPHLHTDAGLEDLRVYPNL